MKKNDLQKAKEYAFKLFKFRARSENEIRIRLKKKSFSEKVIDQVLRDLSELDFIDDYKFAELWVRNRLATKPMGARRLRYELLAKGVDRDIIGTVIQENINPEGETESAIKVAEAKINTYYKGLDSMVQSRRLTAFLARRGFSNAIIQAVVRKLIFEK